jgi:hypothetical protein
VRLPSDPFLILYPLQVEDLRHQASAREWFGHVNSFSSVNAVELTVEGDPDPASLAPKLALVRQLAAEAEPLLAQLHQLAHRKYEGTRWAKPLADIRAMYFLSGVTLKRDNTTWWFVLEPEYSVETIYNHVLRFTRVNGEITWANFDYETPA